MGYIFLIGGARICPVGWLPKKGPIVHASSEVGLLLREENGLGAEVAW